MSRDISPDRLELLGELADAIRAGQRATDVIDDLAAALMGINRTDARCLDILDQRGRMSAGQLAQEAGLTSGAITAVLDRLARAGYVQRIDDPADRRRVLVELTQKAREISEDLFGGLRDLWMPLSERFSDDDLRLLLEFQRLGREIQERHTDFLRRRLAGRGRDRDRGG